MRDHLSEGNTGASAQVLSNITGATTDTGFKGINGNIMKTALGPDATEESKKDFPLQWQEMIKPIFLNADKVIDVTVLN